MKESLQRLIDKLEWEGDFLYVAENWPYLFLKAGLQVEVEEAVAAVERLKSAFGLLCQREGVNYYE